MSAYKRWFSCRAANGNCSIDVKNMSTQQIKPPIKYALLSFRGCSQRGDAFSVGGGSERRAAEWVGGGPEAIVGCGGWAGVAARSAD